MEAAEQFSPTPKDGMAQLMAKFDAYIHLLDLERKRRELLDDVFSPTRGLNLFLMEYLISIARSKLESLLPKPEEEIVVEVGDLEATKEEEVFIEELVPEFGQALTPNSIPDATTDSILDSGSNSGSQTDSSKGLHGFLKLTSNIEDSTVSIGDFTVYPSEEINPIPTGVVDEDDSSDLLPIPPFIFVENEVAVSIDAVSFQLTKIDKTEVNNFERKDQIKWGKCFSTILNISRLIFDPGKYLKLIKRFCYLDGVYEFSFDSITSCSFALPVGSILMAEFDRNPVYKLSSKNGYWLDSRFRDKIDGMLAAGSNSSTSRQLFVKMLLMDIVCYEQEIHKHIIQLADSRLLFDRGKYAIDSSIACRKFILPLILSMAYNLELQFISSIALVCVKYVDTHSSCVIVLLGFVLLEIYNENLVLELLPRHGYPFKFQFLNLLGLGVVKVAEIDGEWNLVADFSKRIRFVFLLWARVMYFHMAHKWSAQLPFIFARWIYDRGKMFDSTGYYFFSSDAFESCVDTTTSQATVLFVSNGMDEYSDESVYERISELEFYVNLLFVSSNVFLWVISGGSSSAYELDDEVFKRSVSDTMLLVCKSATFMCSCCFDVFNLRTKSVTPLPFNTSTVYSHGFCRVHFHASIHQLSQLWPNGDVCSYRLSNQLLNVLNSAGAFVKFHGFSLVVRLTIPLSSYFRLVRMSLSWHSPLPAPVVYATLAAFEEVEKVYLIPSMVLSLCLVCQQMRGCIHLEFSGVIMRSMKRPLVVLVRVHSILRWVLRVCSCEWVILGCVLAVNGEPQRACVPVHISVCIIVAVIVKLHDACSAFDAQSVWMCGRHSDSIFVVLPHYHRRIAITEVSRTVGMSTYQARDCADYENVYCWDINTCKFCSKIEITGAPTMVWGYFTFQLRGQGIADNGVLVCIHGQASTDKLMKMTVPPEKMVAEVAHLYMGTFHSNQLKIPDVKKEKMLLLRMTAKPTDIFVRSTKTMATEHMLLQDFVTHYTDTYNMYPMCIAN